MINYIVALIDHRPVPFSKGGTQLIPAFAGMTISGIEVLLVGIAAAPMEPRNDVIKKGGRTVKNLPPLQEKGIHKAIVYLSKNKFLRHLLLK